MTEASLVGTEFTSISVAEFFYRNRQMVGFGNPTQAVYSTIRELVENSLDACEDAKILPEINVIIRRESSDLLLIEVSDNGPGMPYQFVPEAFGKVLFGSKYGLRHKRGTFGLGVTMAVLYGQLTTNYPATIITKHGQGEANEFRLLVDIKNNTPIIEYSGPNSSHSIGTKVTLKIRGDLKRSKLRITEYLRLTSVSTPHAQITLLIDDNPPIQFGRYSKMIPTPPRISRPHPRSADIELLHHLISNNNSMTLKAFLVDTFQKCGTKTATRFLHFLSLNPNRTTESLTRDEIVRISNALRNYNGFDKPESQCLSPIGKDSLMEALNRLYPSASIKYEIRGPFEWNGHPTILEGAVVITDSTPAENPSLIRFANKVPLLYDASDDVLTLAMKRINWNRYGVDTNSQVLLFVNLCSTRIPYREAGKQSIAAIPAIQSEAELLFKTLGRAIKRESSSIRRSKRNARKMREFSKYFRLIARYGALLASVETTPDTSKLVESLFEVK